MPTSIESFITDIIILVKKFLLVVYYTLFNPLAFQSKTVETIDGRVFIFVCVIISLFISRQSGQIQNSELPEIYLSIVNDLASANTLEMFLSSIPLSIISIFSAYAIKWTTPKEFDFSIICYFFGILLFANVVILLEGVSPFSSVKTILASIILILIFNTIRKCYYQNLILCFLFLLCIFSLSVVTLLANLKIQEFLKKKDQVNLFFRGAYGSDYQIYFNIDSVASNAYLVSANLAIQNKGSDFIYLDLRDSVDITDSPSHKPYGFILSDLSVSNSLFIKFLPNETHKFLMQALLDSSRANTFINKYSQKLLEVYVFDPNYDDSRQIAGFVFYRDICFSQSCH